VLLPSRRRSWFDLRLVSAYFSGAAAGALGTAGFLWIVSGFAEPLAPWARGIGIALAATVVLAAKHGPVRFRVALPENRRQIPAEVFGRSLAGGAFRFGFEMGTGVRTYVPAAAPYVLALGLVAVRPTLAVAGAAALGFAAGRTVPLVVQMLAPAHEEGVAGVMLGRAGAAIASPASFLIVLAGAFAMLAS